MGDGEYVRIFKWRRSFNFCFLFLTSVYVYNVCDASGYCYVRFFIFIFFFPFFPFFFKTVFYTHNFDFPAFIRVVTMHRCTTYVPVTRGNVVDIEYRKGVEPKQTGELGFAAKWIFRSVGYRRLVARSLHLCL